MRTREEIEKAVQPYSEATGWDKDGKIVAVVTLAGKEKKEDVK